MMGEAVGEAKSVALYGARFEVFVVIGFVGTSREAVSGELSSSSGFAMRKPPKDCERLRSLSIM